MEPENLSISEESVFSDFLLDEMEQKQLNESSIRSVVPKKRGPKKIPEKWTRVININTDDLGVRRIYDIASDLLLNQASTGIIS